MSNQRKKAGPHCPLLDTPLLITLQKGTVRQPENPRAAIAALMQAVVTTRHLVRKFAIHIQSPNVRLIIVYVYLTGIYRR